MKHKVGIVEFLQSRKGAYTCILIIVIIFGYLGGTMGASNMLNTMLKTAHDLLLNTCFYLMAVCVLTGAFCKVLIEFGVANIMERLLRPLMKPFFGLPGVASLGAVMTFLSDNPAIITLSRDKKFSQYFKKYQLVSLTNFGTAFGMGMIVIMFMISLGFYTEPIVGLVGALIGSIVSTRLMQFFILKSNPELREPVIIDNSEEHHVEMDTERKSAFIRTLDAVLDGGKTGVETGLAIIPGVLVISTLVMLLTFSAGPNGYTGEAYQGTEALPWLADKIDFVFKWLFGFTDGHLVAFPITALGAVGAALGLLPNFLKEGWLDANSIAVFTAIGMCWSGFLSTHTAMLDSLGYRRLITKAILAHTIGGLAAGICAHWLYVLIHFLFNL
ncbi:MAG: hypothetical protein HUJ89_03670 [Bacteroidales bacterium]|nr:hypothetical protein [Bacteroidales bacterium]